jgi:hypothetical protein
MLNPPHFGICIKYQLSHKGTAISYYRADIKKNSPLSAGNFSKTYGFLVAKALTETLTETANSFTKATDWSFVSFGGLWLAGSLTLGGSLGLGSGSLRLLGWSLTLSGRLGLGSGSLCLLSGYRGLALAAGDAGEAGRGGKSESSESCEFSKHSKSFRVLGTEIVPIPYYVVNRSGCQQKFPFSQKFCQATTLN